MSVSGVSSSSSSSLNQSDWFSLINQWMQDFKQLASSLQSGDLTGAQQAFAALQQLQQNNQSGSQSSTVQPASSSTNPIQNDFTALSQALSSNNLSAAQSAFSQLQTDMLTAGPNSASGGVQSAHHGHHHHHHHVSSSSDSDSTTTDQTSSTGSTGSQSASTAGTFSIYA
jgi:hypothetical protein